MTDDVNLSPHVPVAGAPSGGARGSGREGDYLFSDARGGGGGNGSPDRPVARCLIITTVVVALIAILAVVASTKVDTRIIRTSANDHGDQLAALAAQISSIQNTLSPKGFSRTDGCRYSDPAIVAISNDAQSFYLNIFSGNQDFAYSSGYWDRFTSEFVDIESVGNVSMKVAQGLQTRIREALASPTVMTSEKLSLGQILSDVDLFVNLTQIGLFHVNYGSYVDYTWIADPSLLTAETVAVLTAPSATYHTANADFVPRVQLWMTNYLAKAQRMIHYYQRAINQGKTHANVTMVRTFARYEAALAPGMFTPLCTLLASINSAANCAAVSAQIDTANTALLNFYRDSYLPACATSRPNARPGLVWIPDGATAYEIFLQYHLGYETTPTFVYNTGVEQLALTKNLSITVAQQLFNKEDVAWSDVVSYIANTSDPNLYFFGPTSIADTISYLSGVRNSIDRKLNLEIGYITRAHTYVAITGSASTNWQSGGYDTKRRLFTSAARYNVGVHGLDAGGNPIFDRVGATSTCLHEAFPGHGLQVPLAQEVDCQLSAFASAPTSFVEGWALYVETFGFVFGLYDDLIQRLGHYNANMLRANRLQADTALHSTAGGGNGWSYDQAWQSMAANGFAAEYAQTEIYRYITMPGQATGYMIGKLKLLSLREYTKSQLTAAGVKFDPLEFNLVLTKFGGATLDDLQQLIETYVAVKIGVSDLDDGPESELFGYDLITNMFSATLPVIGLGRP